MLRVNVLAVTAILPHDDGSPAPSERSVPGSRSQAERDSVGRPLRATRCVDSLREDASSAVSPCDNRAARPVCCDYGLDGVVGGGAYSEAIGSPPQCSA
jgi:hypothetical protein